MIRLELSSDVNRALRRGLRIALFVPPLVVGYAFGMMALATWLGRHWGFPLALGVVAALQLVPAGLGIWWTVAALGRTPLLERTGAELRASSARLEDVRSSLVEPPGRSPSSHD